MSHNSVLSTSTRKETKDNAAVTKDYCESIALKVSKLQDFPVACKQYEDIYAKVEKKVANVDPFYGMHPGAAIQARASRKSGGESAAQIQRRLTTGGRRFSKLDK